MSQQCTTNVVTTNVTTNVVSFSLSIGNENATTNV